MRFLTRSLTGLLLLAATLGCLALAGKLVADALADRLAREPVVPPVRERTFAVNVTTATPRTIAPVLTVFGEIRSARTLDLRAAAAGTVIALAADVREGGQVRAGQELLRIDPTEAEAGLRRAEADLADAEAETRDAARGLVIATDTLAGARDQAALRGKALSRQEQLVSRGIGSPAAVEEAELAVSAARQAVLSARSALALAEARVDSAATALSRARISRDEARRALADRVITAPFDGRLSQVTLVQGRLLARNEVVAQLVDPLALEVGFRISTRQYLRLLDAQGRLRDMPVDVTLGAPDSGLTARGRISRDSAAVGEGQTGRLVIASLESGLSGARGLKPGDFVTVRVQEDPIPDVIRLPASALDAAGQVLVVNEDRRLGVAAVDLLRRQGDAVLLHAPGLAGRDVVLERSPLLGAGILVRPNRTGAVAAGPAPIEGPGPALIRLSPDQRARFVAFVQDNSALPDDLRVQLLGQLAQDRIPAEVVEGLERRMGG